MNAREHIQAGLDDHRKVSGLEYRGAWCYCGHRPFPCPDRERYEALLKILNNTRILYLDDHDYRAGVPQRIPQHSEDTLVRLVPDPQSGTPEAPDA